MVAKLFFKTFLKYQPQILTFGVCYGYNNYYRCSVKRPKSKKNVKCARSKAVGCVFLWLTSVVFKAVKHIFIP